MTKALKVLSAVIAVGLISGCYVAPVMPPPGLIYSGISSPIDTDAESTTVSPNEGRASSASVLGLVAWGDSSVTTAAQEGGIQTIDHVDYEYKNIIGIYQQFTTVAHGQ